MNLLEPGQKEGTYPDRISVHEPPYLPDPLFHATIDIHTNRYICQEMLNNKSLELETTNNLTYNKKPQLIRCGLNK